MIVKPQSDETIIGGVFERTVPNHSSIWALSNEIRTASVYVGKSPRNLFI
jgi:hypothetical protein